MKIMKKNAFSHTDAENLIITLLLLFSVVLLTVSFFPAAKLSVFLSHELEMKRITERVFSILMIVTCYNLYARRKIAWYITICILSLNILQHLFTPKNTFSVFLIACYLLFLILFILFRSSFCCPSEHESVRKSILILFLAAAAILLNTTLSYHLLRTEIADTPRRILFWYSLSDTFGILFGMTNNNAPGFPNVFFEDFMFWFTWICLLAALLYALRPWITRYFWTEKGMQRARPIVLKYGQNPASYLTLEEDKFLFFSHCCPEAVIPYGIVASTVIVNGDPICPPEHFSEVLREFYDFCRRSSHKLVFLSITDQFLRIYQEMGFGTVKCGEEACFDLSTYNIAGKKGAKMRMNINHAKNSGLTVLEYSPLQKREPDIENAFLHITQEWLSDKKSGMLTFTMGSMGLENPMDRRYFYAIDSTGSVKGFHVFCPYRSQTGYMADITRRSHDAPGGITELINYEAMQVFKEEGIQFFSLGIAPLANLCTGSEESGTLEKVLHFVYEHLNACYGFKNLYNAKASYSPTSWIPGYYAWSPKLPDPGMMYAIVRIQNTRGVRNFLYSAILQPVFLKLFSRKRC